MTGRDDFGDRDREGPIICDGRHRRLAKAGSPATARGCGELWRALLAAAVAVAFAATKRKVAGIIQEGFVK